MCLSAATDELTLGLYISRLCHVVKSPNLRQWRPVCFCAYVNRLFESRDIASHPVIQLFRCRLCPDVLVNVNHIDESLEGMIHADSYSREVHIYSKCRSLYYYLTHYLMTAGGLRAEASHGARL